MDVLQRWRRWIRPVCFTMYFICLIVALPLCIVELENEGAPTYLEAWFIGGLFVMMAVPISFWSILQHLVYYTQPDLQRHIVRVLWMVPVYALNAWFALRFPAAAIYLDTLRECYEAYVIYNFMRYLLNFLYREHPDLEQILERRRRVKHFFPFCCLPPWPRGRVYLNRCKHGVLQYTVVRPAMTILALLCELIGKYDEGNFNFSSGWSYIAIINNASQVWAFYSLILFYMGTKEELAPINPVPKFLCVKAVVFLSFWQSLVIAALVNLDVIPSSGTWVFYDSVEEVATGLQDFLVCVEMFVAALAHCYAFPHQPFAEGVGERGNCCTNCLSMWDVSDVRDDVIDHARYIGRGVQKQLIRGRSMEFDSTEMTPLLSSATTATNPPAPTTPHPPPDTRTASHPLTPTPTTSTSQPEGIAAPSDQTWKKVIDSTPGVNFSGEVCTNPGGTSGKMNPSDADGGEAKDGLTDICISDDDDQQTVA
ncbi:hypothetical protein ACOMHN_062417 [Nucella lapillus]